jgi:hypothetical protein
LTKSVIVEQTDRLKDMGRDYSTEPLGRAIRVVFVAIFAVVVAWGASLAIKALPRPPLTAAEQQSNEAIAKERQAAEMERKQKEQYKMSLCLRAAACRRYDTVRLECAAAGSFKTCLRIKMGDEAGYGDVCSGYDQGAPALPPLPDTPNMVECFVLTMSK